MTSIIRLGHILCLPRLQCKLKRPGKCGICLVDMINDILYCDVSDCQDGICRKCFQGGGNYFVKNNENKCLFFASSKKCLGRYHSSMLDHFLLPIQKLKQEEEGEELRIRNLRVEMNVFTCECPTGGFQVSSDNLLFSTVKCPFCLSVKCRLCGELQHPEGIVCEELQKVKHIFNSKKLKPCPKCGLIIEKTHGCLHMTCCCKYQFCWRCGSLCFFF